MFQFTPFPSLILYIHMRILVHYYKWVPPFGNLRISGYLLLPAAYRSLSRPSSAPSAKASALCSSSLDLQVAWCAIIRSSLSTIVNLTLSENFLVSRWILYYYPLQVFKTYLVLVNSTFVWLTSNTRFVFDFVFALHKILFSFQCPLSPFQVMVENKGLEPLTPCVQGRCSPSWANSPHLCIYTFMQCIYYNTF